MIVINLWRLTNGYIYLIKYVVRTLANYDVGIFFAHGVG